MWLLQLGFRVRLGGIVALRVLVVILVIFAVYAVLHDPAQSADAVSSGAHHLENGLSAVGQFFNDLLAR